MNLKDLISQAEAARIRNVSRASINELVRKGRFKTVEIAGNIFLLRSEVENYQPSLGGRPVKKMSSLYSCFGLSHCHRSTFSRTHVKNSLPKNLRHVCAFFMSKS